MQIRSCLRSPSLFLAAVTLIILSFSTCSYAENNNAALLAALQADYPITKVGMVMFRPDYNRITQPGVVLTVRIPGIYADMANTQQAIINTNIEDGQAAQQKGFLASLSKTNQSRTLDPNETVYVTRLGVSKNTVRMELLTQKVTTLDCCGGTRYRSELNFKISNLDNLSPDEVKKIIDGVIADSATTNAVQSKTIKLGMTVDEVKKEFGNPNKIIDLGTKQIYVYPDMKVVFKDSAVADVE